MYNVIVTFTVIGVLISLWYMHIDSLPKYLHGEQNAMQSCYFTIPINHSLCHSILEKIYACFQF